MSTWDLSGGVAVITGAGSGIGRELAKLLAQEKMSLAIADVNADIGSPKRARWLGKPSAAVSTHVLNDR